MAILGEQNKTFNGKVALITGSGRGIGKAIAIHFASLGADVIINFFRNRDPAEETADIIRGYGGKALVVKANVGEQDGIEHLFSTIDENFDRLDYFISNAASGYNRPAMAQRPKGWDWTMNINAKAFLFCAQKAIPLMEKNNGGAIVSVSSPGSHRVLPDYVVVGASKAALETVTKYLAVELADKNVRVNGISPGLVLTDALSHFNTMNGDRDLIAEATKLTPAGRLVDPQDIANLVAFLCSDASEMIRGQIIAIDGGYTLPIQGII